MIVVVAHAPFARALRAAVVAAVAAALLGIPIAARPAAAVSTVSKSSESARKPSSRRASTKNVAGTVRAIDAAKKTLTLVPLAGGDPITATFSDDATFFKNAKSAMPGDFASGEKVTARLSTPPSGGEVLLRELRDEASQAAYDRDTKAITIGAVAASTREKLDVRRADGSVVSFKVSKGTRIQKKGAEAAMDAFPTGSKVAVKPRSSFGNLYAAVVAETEADVKALELDARTSWTGRVESLDVAKNTLTMKRDDGATRTVALLPTMTVKKGRSTLALTDVTPGTTVRLHLQKGTNNVGQRTADRITLTTPRKPRQ